MQQNILNCSASLSHTPHFEFPIIPTSHGLASSSWPLGEQWCDVGYLQENLVRLLTSRRGIYQADRPRSSGVYGTFFTVLQPLTISINTETLSNRHDVERVWQRHGHVWQVYIIMLKYNEAQSMRNACIISFYLFKCFCTIQIYKKNKAGASCSDPLCPYHVILIIIYMILCEIF